ncbi:hypothetical protein QEN19_000269 [Hanseniaspora menglaensis]
MITDDLMLKELKNVFGSLQVLSINKLDSSLLHKRPTDGKILDLINEFLEKTIYNFFDLDCLCYVSFFDINRELIFDLIGGLHKFINNKLTGSNHKIYFKLKDNIEVFESVRDMAFEFKEIYYDLIPNIKNELLFENDELKKLVAFNKMDIENNKYRDDYALDHLLNLALIGGNALFFDNNKRYSSISEKRLSLLSNNLNKGVDLYNRKNMPIFLNKKDMIIFEDLLEIEKLNDALFRSLREILSEKIENFNEKYNSKSVLFQQLINVIKNEYVILDKGFEELTHSLKGLEQKITVCKWVCLIDKLFSDCLEFVDEGIAKIEKKNLESFNEGVEIIQKTIKLLHTLNKVSWDDYLCDKIQYCKANLELSWARTKLLLDITEPEENILKVTEQKPKQVEDIYIKKKLRKSLLFNEKPVLSKKEKRQSVGAAFFQRLNLRASLISSDSDIKSPKPIDTYLLDMANDYSAENPNLLLAPAQSFYIKNAECDKTMLKDIGEGESLETVNEMNNSAKKIYQGKPIIASKNQLLENTLHHEQKELTLFDLDIEDAKPLSKLIITKENLLKFANIKTKIPKNQSSLSSLLEENVMNHSFLPTKLLMIERQNIEKILDVNRAHLVYDVITEVDISFFDVIENFKSMSIKEPTPL